MAEPGHAFGPRLWSPFEREKKLVSEPRAPPMAVKLPRDHTFSSKSL